MMKKVLAFALALIYLTASVTFGSAEADKKLTIVTTIFPQYDWVRQILGDDLENNELILLLNDGTDLHSYQPTAKDIATIAFADLFIYVGGESDQWVDGVVAAADNRNLHLIAMESFVEAKPEVIVEGMQAHDHDHDHAEEAHDHAHDHDHAEEAHDHAYDHDHAEEAHDHAHDHDHDHAEEAHDHDHDHDHAEDSHDHDHDELHTHGGAPVNDEHVWLSLKFANQLVGVIANQLAELKPEKADMYLANAAAYQEKLMELDQRYEAAVVAGARKDVLFADRFPFRYLTDDYGLTYSAAFVGCSSETEASFETIAFLANKVKELDLPAVFTIEGAQHRIADTVIQNSGRSDVKILTMNSLQSVTGRQVDAGLSYLDVMTENLKALEAGLK